MHLEAISDIQVRNRHIFFNVLYFVCIFAMKMEITKLISMSVSVVILH